MRILLCFALMPWFTNCTYIETATGISGGKLSTDDKIQPEELYGVWTFNEFTSKHIDRLKSVGLKELSADDNTIEIAKDGTCRFNTYTSFHPSGYHLISTGKWSLKKTYDSALEAEIWQIEFELRPDSVRVVGVPFYLKRESGQLKMYNFIDDPDQNQLVEFERTFAKSSGD